MRLKICLLSLAVLALAPAAARAGSISSSGTGLKISSTDNTLRTKLNVSFAQEASGGTYHVRYDSQLTNNFRNIGTGCVPRGGAARDGSLLVVCTRFPGTTIDIRTTAADDIIILGRSALDPSTNQVIFDATTITTGDGKDTVTPGAGPITATLGAGNNTASGSPQADTISGGDGNNTIQGGDGNNALAGQAGNDAVSGNAGDDGLTGSDGDDGLFGDAGDDAINGGDGADGINPGLGADRTTGGTGDDRFLDFSAVADAADVIDGGIGSDLMSYRLRTTDVTIFVDNAANNGGANERDQLIAIDRAELGAGNDRYFSFVDDLPDTVSGGPGNDIIRSGAGPDDIRGDAGADELTAGSGIDVVDSRDGTRDTISCGDGTPDQLFSDSQADIEPANCEGVTESPKGEPLPLQVSSRARRSGGRLLVAVSCPAKRPRCRGTLNVLRGARTLGSARFNVASGRKATLRVAVSQFSGLRARLTEKGRQGTRRTQARLSVRR